MNNSSRVIWFIHRSIDRHPLIKKYFYNDNLFMPLIFYEYSFVATIRLFWWVLYLIYLDWSEINGGGGF